MSGQSLQNKQFSTAKRLCLRVNLKFGLENPLQQEDAEGKQKNV